MKKGWKITLSVIAGLLVLILAGPFLVPVMPLDNNLPPVVLADPDSQFIEINNVLVHYKRMGAGEPTFILLHGFGASTFSWREVMAPLAEVGQVIAYDRPGFGLTERPLDWEGVNPYSEEGNLIFLLGLLDTFGLERAILVGNSAGGTLATAFTLAYPERVQALIEVDAAIYQTMPDSALLTWLLNTPQMDHLGPLIARSLGGNRGTAFLESAWYDPTLMTANPEVMDGYRKPLQVENWDQALWEHTKATRPPGLAGRLDQITIPTLVISGAEDQIVPLANSQRLAEDIPHAVLVIIGQCGHLPQEECPQPFIQAVLDFIETIQEEKR
jgi:pimeloyl-ACP methyl ester carboxylesterase